ncbi:MAG: hypothetical protein ACK6D3_00005, partial [Planctomycetaceae bacterium]
FSFFLVVPGGGGWAGPAPAAFYLGRRCFTAASSSSITGGVRPGLSAAIPPLPRRKLDWSITVNWYT